MVNVSEKPITRREASAEAILATTPTVVAAIQEGAIEKGDVIAAGRLAGIMGVKRTPDLLPLCHPIAVTDADVFIDCGEDTLTITSRVGIHDRTGVEMEALTAVAVAGLAVIDMIKSRDASAEIRSIRLLEKSGGKSGRWVRGGDR